MERIVGRKQELEKLQKILEAKRATFLVVYGRRRIGKTYLIKNFFKTKGVFFHLTGLQDTPTETQLQNFAVELSDSFLKGKPIKTPKNWFSAFQLLRKEVQKVPQSTPLILFFDEIPWLSTPRSNFVQALEHLWNRYLSDMPNIILVVCGSAASWMIENILHHKGGLHGRVTNEMRLMPFTLSETEEFLREKNISYDRKQILELYMCLGGVAKYLTYLEKGKSVAQAIGELCFSYNAPLISEFHKLYRSLFHNHEALVAIVRALAAVKSGLSYQELAKQTHLVSGGTLTKQLEELTQSGFIIKVPLFGEGEKKDRYVLIDEYSLFYLTWNSGVSSLDLQGRRATYWIKKRNTQAWKSWIALAFEALCLKHIEGIKAALGISALETASSQWKHSPSRSNRSGAQIDLVIDRADRCIHLCEIKFSDKKFLLTKAYAQNLQKKRACFEEVTDTRKSTFITLITTFGATHNSAYLSCVDQELTMDSLFLSEP